MQTHSSPKSSILQFWYLTSKFLHFVKTSFLHTLIFTLAGVRKNLRTYLFTTIPNIHFFNWSTRYSYSAMGPDELYPSILRELAGVVKPLSIIFEKSWQSGPVPSNWKKGNIAPIFAKGRKGESETCRQVSTTSVPWKITQQILMETMLRHMQDIV